MQPPKTLEGEHFSNSMLLKRMANYFGIQGNASHINSPMWHLTKAGNDSDK